MIDIDKAFENRWRYKWPDYDECETRLLSAKEIKKLCRDFFEAGITLGNGDYSIQRENTIPTGRGIMTVEEGIEHTKKLRFETWWEMYDLKCGRKDCLKKWMKMSLDEIQACINHTPAYVASTPDKQFRKRPLTYLNQKAFYDEIIVRHNPDQQRQQRLASAAERIAEYTKDGK